MFYGQEYGSRIGTAVMKVILPGPNSDVGKESQDKGIKDHFPS